jgi:hypothetical protein
MDSTKLIKCVKMDVKVRQFKLFNLNQSNYWNVNVILTFCCPQSPLVQCAMHNPRYLLACKCFHFPSKTPWLDHQIHFCSQPNRDWNSLVARQNHHDVELPANNLLISYYFISVKILFNMIEMTTAFLLTHCCVRS